MHAPADNREDFLDHYNVRQNAETVFSMVKGSFDGYVKSKSRTAQINEIYAKFVCHNICRLIHAIYEMGLEPEFWQDAEVA